MAAFKTFLRLIMPLIFLFSAQVSVAATTLPSAHAAPAAQIETMSDCHDRTQKEAAKSHKAPKSESDDSCCDKACACALSHCQTPAQAAPSSDTKMPAPSVNTRYEAFSKRLLSAIREQIKPPPKS
ncbi:hypothetical protein OVA03_00990 [Asticcacaulis sp. SL142]|uniref:hypothetical protein n=1 Tax=Asticcacaulis sp. SL142 TaxID=2995155 RepID=UPI00226C8E70|nr:hypothetical protein [Asticcacaulis sp. SL142]WAC48542.1 hypothetical protein OVA03_00990 [Asticcacaulis sp. SL142]